jgi:hypothetical protein
MVEGVEKQAMKRDNSMVKGVELFAGFPNKFKNREIILA